MTEISIHVPTRGTTFSNVIQSPVNHFNPRAHEGHDHILSCCNFSTIISIHVPTRGTTREEGVTYDRLIISIHVPTRGTTHK